MCEWDDDFDSVDVADDVMACPDCGGEVYVDAERCPGCGHWVTDAERMARSGEDARWVKWAAILLLLVFVLGVIASMGW